MLFAYAITGFITLFNFFFCFKLIVDGIGSDLGSFSYFIVLFCLFALITTGTFSIRQEFVFKEQRNS